MQSVRSSVWSAWSASCILVFMRFWKLHAAFLAVVLLTGASDAQTPRSPKPGERAPDFTLPNGDGKLVRLSDLTAKGPVVVVFYRGFW